VEWALAGVSKLKRIKKEKKYQKTPGVVIEKDVKHILFDCLERTNFTMKFLYEKCLNVNKTIAYREI
jgi:hypothetical protein